MFLALSLSPRLKSKLLSILPVQNPRAALSDTRLTAAFACPFACATTSPDFDSEGGSFGRGVCPYWGPPPRPNRALIEP